MLFYDKDGGPRSPLDLVQDFDRHIAVFGELALPSDAGAMEPTEVFTSLSALREDHLQLVQTCYEWARAHKNEPVSCIFGEEEVVQAPAPFDHASGVVS